jgi:ribosomal protein L22
MAVEIKEYRAEARFQRVSPQKARLVLELIKGRGVQEALETAAFTKKRIAPVIHKLLISAVDNAKYVSGEKGTDVDVDNLYVKTAVANDGPRMKRIRPAPMGRAFRKPGHQGRRACDCASGHTEDGQEESCCTKGGKDIEQESRRAESGEDGNQEKGR